MNVQRYMDILVCIAKVGLMACAVLGVLTFMGILP